MYGDKRGDELPEDIDTEEKLKKKLEEVTKKFNRDKEKTNLTDPDAHFMKGGRRPDRCRIQLPDSSDG